MMYLNRWTKLGMVALACFAGFVGCSSANTESTEAPGAAQTPPAPAASAAVTADSQPQRSKRQLQQADSRALANDLFAPQSGSNSSTDFPAQGATPPSNPFQPLADALGAVGDTLAGDGSSEADDSQGTVLGSLRNALRQGIAGGESESARTADLGNPPTN